MPMAAPMVQLLDIRLPHRTGKRLKELNHIFKETTTSDSSLV
jgi:hypothetical protein